MRTPIRLALAALLTLSSACLFDEKPPCRIGGDLCPSGLVCRAQQCVVPGTAGDVGPLTDGPFSDGPPIEPDAAPADARPDGPSADSGPALDARPADAAPADHGPAPDMAPVCADEICNGLDDDCDGEVDEAVVPCFDPDADGARPCSWRHRGHHSYLFCDIPVPEAQALDICVRQYGLTMAVPDTCDESEWLWATGNLTPSPVVWQANARGRAWWLGLRLRFADDGDSLMRTDGDDVPIVEGGCWATGEPDDVLLGETCVDLLYNPVTDDFGWNDDTCGLNQANPVNPLCEVPCDPTVDADRDGENACVDCDDRDPDANSGEGIDRCALAPEAGFPP